MTRRNLLSAAMLGIAAWFGWKPKSTAAQLPRKWIVETTTIASGHKRTWLGGGWDGPLDIIQNSGVPRCNSEGPHTVNVKPKSGGLWEVEAIGYCPDHRNLSVNRRGETVCDDCGEALDGGSK